VNQVFDAVGISWSFTMAFALVASLPVILMFMLVQKWFIAGLTAGAVKG
jgi:ABC-type glycerol-3-phosphate transport system permease component